MGLSKTEVNLRRLLAAAPRQQNQAKLMHYVATLREQLEKLGTETTTEGPTSISKAKLNDYSEKIEEIAAILANQAVQSHLTKSLNVKADKSEDSITTNEQAPHMETTTVLRRRHVNKSYEETEDKAQEIAQTNQVQPIKLDTAAQAHIEKHRKLQEDLTDEMVVLARQLKESSLMMSESVHNTEKIVNSTERAVEHSLSSTGRVNTRAAEIYSQTSKTSCFTWLLMFGMIFVFVMVVLLIRVT